MSKGDGKSGIFLDAFGGWCLQGEDVGDGIVDVVILAVGSINQSLTCRFRLLQGFADAALHFILQKFISHGDGTLQIGNGLFHVGSHVVEAQVLEAVPESIRRAVELHLQRMVGHLGFHHIVI